MTPERARALIIDVLGEIAPGRDAGSIGPDTDLREALELDSLDFLNFVEALSDRWGRRIDEDDYPHLATLESGTKFLTGGGA